MGLVNIASSTEGIVPLMVTSALATVTDSTVTSRTSQSGSDDNQGAGMAPAIQQPNYE